MYKFLTLISFVALFCCDKSIAWFEGEKSPGPWNQYAHVGWAGVPVINREKASAEFFDARRAQVLRDQYQTRDGIWVLPRAAGFMFPPGSAKVSEPRLMNAQAGLMEKNGIVVRQNAAAEVWAPATVNRVGVMAAPGAAFRDGVATQAIELEKRWEGSGAWHTQQPGQAVGVTIPPSPPTGVGIFK